MDRCLQSPPPLDRAFPEVKTAQWDRKRGTYSYNRLNGRILGPASIGGASFGNVQVNLKWNFRQSQWGCIEGNRPAGILYLDIGLPQQQTDYKLASIIVEVTLEDASPEAGDDIPVQMTDWFGPKQILGREHVQRVSKDTKFTPSFEGFGFGIGGMGKSAQTEILAPSRWEFAGRLKRPNRTKTRSSGGTHYKTLQWTVTENELETARNNTIHIAFTFEHGGQPFHMHAKVEGTLRSKRDRMWHGIKKFVPRHGRPDDVSTTYIGTYFGHRKALDELAKDLDYAMQEKNWRSRPTVMSEPQQASFQEIQPPPQSFLAQREQETRPAPTDPLHYLLSTTEGDMRLTLERLALAGQRSGAAARVDTAPNDSFEVPSLSVEPGQSDAANQSLSESTSTLQPSTASAPSNVSSAITLVDQVDQTAAINRLPRVATKAPPRPFKRKSTSKVEAHPPPVRRKSTSRLDVISSKQPDGLLGMLPNWVAAIFRLYLLLWVALPLRCLRACMAVVTTTFMMVKLVEERISELLAKHAQI